MADNNKKEGFGNLTIAAGGPGPGAKEVIKEFFSWYTPDEAKEELLDLLFAAFGSEDADSWGGPERGRLVFLYRQLVKLIAAVYTETKAG